jgi:DNA-binding transcriptional LysR family regulator
MTSNFDQRALRSFVVVAEAGSIGAAALSLNVSQPTLSRLIRTLEHRCAAALFERHPTGITLTSAGGALLPYARLLLFEMEQAAEALRVVRGLQPSIVRVGVIPPAVDQIVMPVIGQLLQESPEIEVQLLEENDDRLFSALRTNAVDLVIGPQRPPCDEISQLGNHLFEDFWTVFCSINHPLLRPGGDLKPLDVLPGRWVMSPPGTSPRMMFDDIVRRHGFPQPQVAIHTASPDGAIASVINAGVLGWMPELLYARELACGLVARLPIAALTLSDRIFVYKRTKGILSPDTRRFCNALLSKSRVAPIAS